MLLPHFRKMLQLGGGQFSGGYSIFFSPYLGLGSASTVHQKKKISGISSTPKKYMKF